MPDILPSHDVCVLNLKEGETQVGDRYSIRLDTWDGSELFSAQEVRDRLDIFFPEYDLLFGYSSLQMLFTVDRAGQKLNVRNLIESVDTILGVSPEELVDTVQLKV